MLLYSYLGIFAGLCFEPEVFGILGLSTGRQDAAALAGPERRPS